MLYYYFTFIDFVILPSQIKNGGVSGYELQNMFVNIYSAYKIQFKTNNK